VNRPGPPSRDARERWFCRPSVPISPSARLRSSCQRSIRRPAPWPPRWWCPAISSAAFWLVAAAITPAAEITLETLGLNPTRGPASLDVLEADGCLGSSAQPARGGR